MRRSLTLMLSALVASALAGCGSESAPPAPLRGDAGGDVPAPPADGALAVDASLPTPDVAQGGECNVRAFGAVGDGVTDDTAAIQNAINACSVVSGTVHVPPGTYLVHTMSLRSNVTLQMDGPADGAIDAGPDVLAKLIWSSDINSYLTSNLAPPAIMMTYNAQNITIKGKGVFDGGGAAWWAWYRADNTRARPDFFYFNKCQNVRIEDVTFINAPMFHVYFEQSQYIEIIGVTVNTDPSSPNTDAIDVKSCQHVHIANCNLSAGDDNVAVTTAGSAAPAVWAATDTLVENCFFGRGHGMSIGSGTKGGINGLVVRNIQFDGTDNGIRIKTSREDGPGGLITNCSYDQITMKNVKNAIVLDEYYGISSSKIPKPGQPDPSQPLDGGTVKPPVMNNIRISNLTATNIADAGPSGKVGTIRGLPESFITDVTFENVNIQAGTGLIVRNAKGIKFINSNITAAKGGAIIAQENVEVIGLPVTDYFAADGGAIDAPVTADGGAPADAPESQPDADGVD